MTRKITRDEATISARTFIRTVSDGSDWSLSTIEAHLPSGFYLSTCDDADFYPLTIKNVSNAIRHHARWEHFS